jgi:hypothetical protein
MTPARPCKVIRYESYWVDKRPPAHNSFNPAGRYQPHLPKTNSSPAYPVYDLGTGLEFADQLLALEKKARYQYSKILESLSLKELPGRLDQMLDHSFLPTLHLIGFEEPISKVLFKIAPSSWKLIGPLDEKIITFHPVIDQQVEEVKHGLESNAGKKSGMLPSSVKDLPQIISGTIKDKASPENLFGLLDEIATPWIILPRAFRFLKKNHCRYLPAYLKTIDRETREMGLKVFSRITTEFLGNFCLKFADRHHPPDQLTKLLFYGYSALFWKNLRCPPDNLENSLAFDNFFRWICNLRSKNDFLGNQERSAIKRMIKMKTMTFPGNNFNHPHIQGKPDISRFIVTLRHGSIGIATILKYFGIDQFLESREMGERFACPSVQNEVHNLLNIIQTKFHLESKQTIENIKLFIDFLRSAYSQMQTSFYPTDKKFINRKVNNLQILLNK